MVFFFWFYLNRGSRFKEEVDRFVVGGKTKMEGVLASEDYEPGLMIPCVHAAFTCCV